MSLAADRASSDLHEQVQRLLVCPRCRSKFIVTGSDLRCSRATCGFVGGLANDVVVLNDRANLSFFDNKHEIMATGNQAEGVQCICYEKQACLVESLLPPGALVLDVGCGPELPYKKPSDTFVIGLEASYESIVANHQVDMRIYGTAAEIPLTDQSVDVVLAFYAVHHMTGQTTTENRQTVARAFREFGRVVKPGGELLVFEVSPWAPIWAAEKLLWNTTKSILGRKLDMFFYSARAYETLGQATLPGATFSVQPFQIPMTTFFPPVFSLPWLKVPRFIYPMDANLYRWRF